MAENKERADTERRTDMKQIRRISDVAGELGETALLRLGKLSITKKKVQKGWLSFCPVLPEKSWVLPFAWRQTKQNTIVCSVFPIQRARGEDTFAKWHNYLACNALLPCAESLELIARTVWNKPDVKYWILLRIKQKKKKGVSTVVQTLHRVCF